MSYRLSFCTVCMNRTEHLKITLPQNIADNLDYGNIEFVLLNYNSTDDMHEWVFSTLGEYLEKGILKYYHTVSPEYFQMSHSKNMAFRLAHGDILCGIDADNFTGKGFAFYVNEQFTHNRNIFMMPPPIGPEKKRWDVQGRICVYKDDFYTLRGFDERVKEYGYEDKDFKQRLLALGREKSVIRNDVFLQAIRHDDKMRISGGLAEKKLKQLFICDGDLPEIIYLQENNNFEKVQVDPALLTYDGKELLKTPIRKIYCGSYEKSGDQYILYKKNNEKWLSLSILKNGHLRTQDEREFAPIPRGLLSENFLLQRAIYLGKKIYESNKTHGNPVNPEGFGQGFVFTADPQQTITLD